MKDILIDQHWGVCLRYSNYSYYSIMNPKKNTIKIILMLFKLKCMYNKGVNSLHHLIEYR